MRNALVSLCLFTAAAACWLFVMETVLRHAGFAGRMAIEPLIVAQSALTVLGATGRAGGWWRPAASAGACALLVLGVSAFISNESGRHFEGYVFVISIALVLQGVLTLVSTLPSFWRI